MKFDLAIVGAGLAGLTCAKHLQDAGYKLIVFDKARGIGGRATTRRIEGTFVDRGLPYLQNQGELTQGFIARLQQADIIQPWGDRFYTLSPNGELVATPQATGYSPPRGVNAIAKFFAGTLDIRRNHRATLLLPSAQGTWQLHFDNAPDVVQAKAVVLAIPAPQAVALLQTLTPTSLSPEFISKLQAVEYDPCITVAAGYSAARVQNLPWQAVKIEQDEQLAWVIEDSSKCNDAVQPTFIFHSTPQFARDHLDTADLTSIGDRLRSRAAQLLLPWLDNPEWSMVHRWRYARTCTPLNHPCWVASEPLPLVCCGDWCLGDRVEDALQSGVAAARAIEAQFNH
ncbi:MAG: FAD-dependent oxidoreductase [Cyanobacteriota bacterium]|nr:FAD-dependent oxidoreductase [Cyanobacteriota bacterium]